VAISQQQTERFNKFLEDELGLRNLSCDVCQNNTYSIDIIAGISQKAAGMLVQHGSFDLTGPIHSYVVMACKRCGYAKFFDASVAGLDNIEHE
jgi:predicted nucleic-acid-binding Zn-ribbon protein